MWQKIKEWFLNEEEQPVQEAAPSVPKQKKSKKTELSTKEQSAPDTAPSVPKQKKSKKTELSAKEQATQEGKPYVNIIGFELDPANPSLGSFEIDWNQQFINQLLMQGYRGENDEQIIDQWFQSVCRTIAMEEYEQFMADPSNRVSRKDLGGGRTEFS